MIVAHLCKVTCNFKYQGENETDTWHCATMDGARRFVEGKRKDLRWYSIEEQTFRTCNEDDPDGLLYIGLKNFEFEEFK